METTPANPSREWTRSLVEEILLGIRSDLRAAGLAPAGEIELAARWDGGTVILRPGSPGLQEKEIPIETFFHKIVLARERLRVLEQKINNHPKLSDAERIELQEYITRIYGSFTTFNLLFDNRFDGFAGAGTDR